MPGSVDKEIKIGIILDQKGQELMRELLKKSQEINKQLGLGGSGSQQGGSMVAGPGSTASMNNKLTKVMGDSQKAMQGFGKVSQETARMLDNGFKKSVDSEIKSLDKLTDYIRDLKQEYQQLSDLTVKMRRGEVAGGDIGKLSAQRYSVFEKLRGAEAQHAARWASLSDSSKGMPGMVGAEVEGGGSSFMSTSVSRATAAFAANALRDIFSNLPKELNQRDFDYTQMQARGAHAMGGMGVGLLQGNASLLYGMRTMDPAQMRDMEDLAGNGTSRHRWGAVSNFLSLGTLAHPFQSASNLSREWSGANQASKEDVRRLIDTQSQTNPITQASIAMFSGEAGRNIHAMRTLGMGEQSLAKLFRSGGGAGLDEGQMISIGQAVQQGAGRYGLRKGGAFGAGMSAYMGGMSEGAISSMLQGEIARPGAGAQLLSAFATRPGGMDTIAAQHMGAFVGNSLMNGNGITSGLGLGGALTAYGFNGTSRDLLTAKQNQAGVGGINALFSGSIDPYQQGRNLLNSIDILGPNSSVYAQNTLAGGLDARTMADVMSGEDVPEQLKARGINRDQVMKMFDKTVSSGLDRLIDVGTDTDEGKAAKLLKEKYGGDIRSFAKGEIGKGKSFNSSQGFAALGTLLQDEGLAGSYDEAVGMARDLAGMGRKVKGSGKGGDASYGSVSRLAQHAQVEGRAVQRDQALFDPEVARTFKVMAEMSGPISKLVTSWGDLSKETKDLVGGFQALNLAMAMIAKGDTRSFAQIYADAQNQVAQAPVEKAKAAGHAKAKAIVTGGTASERALIEKLSRPK
jgi:hypothetical protein